MWCAGCTNGIVMRALIDALLSVKADADKVAVVAGIGCAGRITTYLDYSTVHCTHGRALVVATGAKVADPSLQVIVIMGDGDCAAIGGNHLIHTARRNVDLTALVLNNSIYGMTGGQAGPTTHEGDFSKTSPYGHAEQAFDICELSRAAGATFVARGTAYSYMKLVGLIAAGVGHKGFSLVKIESACPRSTVVSTRHLPRPRCCSPRSAAPCRPGASRPARRPMPTRTVGVLHHVERTEYLDAYAEVQRRAQAASGVRAPRLEIRLSGRGGQGLVLASVVLAEAAAATGREVVQTQTYGPEARGGASRAEVIVSDEEIDFPELVSPDITICLSQEAFDTFAAVTRDGGLVLYDEQIVVARPVKGVRLVGAPLTSLAQQAAGTPWPPTSSPWECCRRWLPRYRPRRSSRACTTVCRSGFSRPTSLPCGPAWRPGAPAAAPRG